MADFPQYGMFVILVPVCIAPALVVLFWGDWKAKKLGGTFLHITMREGVDSSY